MKKKPEIGAKMYFINEHLYYVPRNPAPITEYCVCEGVVTGFFSWGYEEIDILGKSPEGHTTPYRFKLSLIGKQVFYTPKEAALLAQKMTEQYERTWGWIGGPGFPMRKSWEKYLK